MGAGWGWEEGRDRLVDIVITPAEMLAKIQVPSNIKDICHKIQGICTVRRAVTGRIYLECALFWMGIVRALCSSSLQLISIKIGIVIIMVGLNIASPS